MRFMPIPVNATEFRIWDVIANQYADDGYYQTIGDAQHACTALADLNRLAA